MILTQISLKIQNQIELKISQTMNSLREEPRTKSLMNYQLLQHFHVLTQQLVLEQQSVELFLEKILKQLLKIINQSVFDSKIIF